MSSFAEIKKSRWGLFGHILLLPLDIPCQQSMNFFFSNNSSQLFLEDPELVSVIDADGQGVGLNKLKTIDDLNEYRRLASNRLRWKKSLMKFFKRKLAELWRIPAALSLKVYRINGLDC
jgi:hypothetical protein